MVLVNLVLVGNVVVDGVVIDEGEVWSGVGIDDARSGKEVVVDKEMMAGGAKAKEGVDAGKESGDNGGALFKEEGVGVVMKT